MSIHEEIKSKLFDYQLDHLNNLLSSISKYRRCLDASDTGTGKTYVAVALCKVLNLEPYIIAPKTVLNSWHKVLKFFEIKNYYLVNYERLKNCGTYKGVYEIKMKCPYLRIIGKRSLTKEECENDILSKKTYKPIYRWENIPENTILIFDEVHKCKNKISNNSELLIKAADAKCKMLLLSATVSEKIDTFISCGYALGFYSNLKQGKKWIMQCAEKYNLETNPMLAIHKYIFNEYASRMKISMLPNIFPKNTVIADCYVMENAIEIQKMYDLIKQAVQEATTKELHSEALAKITYARMKIESLKIPKALQMAKDFMNQGKSIAIFTNFTETINILSPALGTNCVVYGEQKIGDRYKNIDRFNNNEEKVIICNIKSGGVGISLHDTSGKHPRVAIIFPSYSAQDMLQALGRINRAGGKSDCLQYILYCKDTIEENICHNIKEKIMNIGYLNDGNYESYKIKNMIEADDDNLFVDRLEDNMFDKLYLQIEVLHAKKERVENELKQINSEIGKLQTELEKFINYT